MNFEEAEKDVLSRYEEILSHKGYKLEKTYNLKKWKDYNILADAAIVDKEENILSIIEIKTNLRDKGNMLYEVETIARRNDIQFYIIINFIEEEEGKISYIHELYSTKKKTSRPLKISKGEEGIHQIIGNLINKYNKNLFLNDIKLLEYNFKGEIINFLHLQNRKNNTISNWQALQNLIESKKEFIIEGKNPFYFETSFEEDFFNLLLNPQKISSVCRYMSFNALFSMLDNRKFRMNGICGMNDKSEIDYVENFVYKNKENDSEDEIENINNTFILSCCDLSKEDNLTMWRLYGDDAKGVNLILDLKNKNIDDFYFARVIYDTKILEILKEIVHIFKRLGFKFIFKKLYYYKHFFKPQAYQEEQEIRLLYKKEKAQEKQWKITQPFNILNPYIEFDIDTFPLELKTIILGPTLKEQMLNKNQLQSFLEDKNQYEIEIRASKIKNYRNLY